MKKYKIIILAAMLLIIPIHAHADYMGLTTGAGQVNVSSLSATGTASGIAVSGACAFYGICPKESPCVISYPLAWGNVIGTQNVWCVSGQWHTDAVVTVMPVNGVDIVLVGNPFEVK